MTSIKAFSVFLILFLASFAYSQENPKIALCKEVENTYQIISKNKRKVPSLTSDVCEIVKRERKKDETVIYKINDEVSLKIYSEREIPSLPKQMQKIIYSN